MSLDRRHARKFRLAVERLEQLQLLDASHVTGLALGPIAGKAGRSGAILAALPQAPAGPIGSLVDSAIATGIHPTSRPHAAPPSQSAIQSAVASSVRAMAPAAPTLADPKIRPLASQLIAAGVARRSAQSAVAAVQDTSPTTQRSPGPGAIRPMRLSAAIASTAPVQRQPGSSVIGPPTPVGAVNGVADAMSAKLDRGAAIPPVLGSGGVRRGTGVVKLANSAPAPSGGSG